jgi:AGCS family alanine or glycine:cation symporter
VFLLIDSPGEDGALVRTKLYGTVGPDLKAIGWTEPPPGAQLAGSGVFRDFKGAGLTAHAFDREFPGLGKWLVTLAAWLFALSTMISWSYYGEQGVLFLFGKRGILPYKVVFLLLTMLAPVVVSTDAQLGDLADVGTGWMLFANMPIVISMGYLAVRDIDTYFKRLKAGDFVPYTRGKDKASESS